MNPTEIPSKPSGSKWKAALLLVFVFMLGGACGLGGGMLLLRSWIWLAITAPLSHHGPIDKLAAQIESKIGRSFKLSADELRAVHDELAVSSRKAKELRLRVGDEARALVEDSIARIGSHLPADKQANWRQQATARLEPWGLLPAAKKEDKPKPN
jgi:hypothetical protein